MPRRIGAVIAVLLGVFLTVLDGAICNVALPTLSRDLGVSSSDSIWVVNAYQLVILMSLLTFSALGELKGYKRVFLSGMAVFLAGSVMCAAAHSLAWLVAARVGQGLGAAGVMSVNSTLVKLIYPRRHLAKGISISATFVAIASVTGPTVAAGILSVADWPWLFLVNIPVGIVAFAMNCRFLPDNPVRVAGRRLDWRDSVLNALTFGLLIGCIEGYSHGADSGTVAVGALLLLAVGGWFVHTQLHKEFPILPFDLLRIPIFSLSVLTSILSFTAQMLALVSLPFFLQDHLGYTDVQTGLLLTAWPAVVAVAAPTAGWLVGRIKVGILGSGGLAVMTVGCLSLSLLSDDASAPDVIWRLMLCGFGFGFFQSPNNSILIGSAPDHRNGSASGMQATARLVGQSSGAALVALMLHVWPHDGSHYSLMLAAALALAGCVVSSLRLSPLAGGRK